MKHEFSLKHVLRHFKDKVRIKPQQTRSIAIQANSFYHCVILGTLASSVDHDQTPRFTASDQSPLFANGIFY